MIRNRRRRPMRDPALVLQLIMDDSHEENLADNDQNNSHLTTMDLTDQNIEHACEHSDQINESSNHNADLIVDTESENVDEIVYGEDSDQGSSRVTAGQRSSRKRSRETDRWKRNIQKRLRQEGKSYTSVTTKRACNAKRNSCGKLICSENCRFDCNSITDDERRKIFDHYYSIDQVRKDNFIFNSMESGEPKRSQVNSKNRKISVKFHLQICDESRRVCKEAFCKLLDISRAVPDRIRASKSLSLLSPSPYNRGTHQNRPNRISEFDLKIVRDHIASFPTNSSHYSRTSNPNRRYLSPLLSIAKMYDLYRTKCIDESKSPVTAAAYRRTFCCYFNLGFGSIQSDVCARCDSGDANEEHRKEIELALELMKKDRQESLESNNQAFITFDMEKTLPLPKVPTSIAFYLSQLWLYNVGIHVCFDRVNNGYMFTWTEDQAGRGSEEIVSSLLSFLENMDFENVRKLVAWSDSCAGQNKNFYVIALWQLLIGSRRLDEVQHKFPEVGHTYMDSDRDFGLIEKECRKHERVHTPDEYRSIMRNTKRRNPFTVTDMSGGFIQAKELPQKLNLVKRIRNVNGGKIEFSKIREIKVTQFGFYQYRTSFSDDEYKVSILKPCVFIKKSNHCTMLFQEVDIRGRHFDIDLFPETSYSDILRSLRRDENVRVIKRKKAEDLKKLLPYIPRVHRAFYERVIRQVGDDGDENDNE